MYIDRKLIAVGAGIFGYGVLVGWALTADRYEQKLKNLEVRVDVLRDKYDSFEMRTYAEAEAPEGRFDLANLTMPMLKDENPRGDIPAEEAVTGEDGGDDDDEEVDEAKTETIRANLQSLIDTYTADPDAVNAFVNSGQVAIETNTPPFVISRDKYSWDEEEGDDYEKITVTYYPRARIVLDDDNEVMDDVGNTLGWRCLSQFGGESGDPDVVFIRNRKMRTDFEVVKDEENALPLHVKYGMPREEFEVNKAAGTLRLRDEDL